MTISEMEPYERSALLSMAYDVGFKTTTELLHFAEREGITDSRKLFDEIHRRHMKEGRYENLLRGGVR